MTLPPFAEAPRVSMVVRAARGALTWGTFPFVFVGALTLGAAAIDRGFIVWAVPAIIAGAGAIVALLERIHPHVPAWNRPRGDVGTDTKHLVVSLIAVPELFRAATFGALYAASAWLVAHVGFGPWPRDWPLFAQLALAMVVTEFGAYWAHRLMHEVPLLWRLHAVHHTAERLYFLNSVRFHPLDTLMSYAMEAIPLVLLGCPEPVIALFVIFTGVHGLFQHANVRLRLGPLNWIFSMAELHRWHHSTLVAEGNNNYGTNLIFWDVVFGTRFLPRDRHPPDTIGVSALPRFPRGWWAQVRSPFRWEATVRESQ